MILAHGTLYEDSQLQTLRSRLETDCIRTISGPSIEPELVIAACDTLAERIRGGQYDHVLKPFLTTFQIDPNQFQAALNLFTRESLERKLLFELVRLPQIVAVQKCDPAAFGLS